MSPGLREFEVFEQAVGDLFDYHRDVANSIWPRGATLHCTRCGRVQTATVGELANHLAHGWPTCHRETMRLGDAPSN